MVLTSRYKVLRACWFIIVPQIEHLEWISILKTILAPHYCFCLLLSLTGSSWLDLLVNRYLDLLPHQKQADIHTCQVVRMQQFLLEMSRKPQYIVEKNKCNVTYQKNIHSFSLHNKSFELSFKYTFFFFFFANKTKLQQWFLG